MIEVSAEAFEALVRDAVEALPEEFAARIENVAFAVEEWPAAGDAPAGSVLLGVYRGVPLTRRGQGYHLVTPDTIVVFRGPLMRLAHDERDLAARAGRVVRHEIAHYFGISDDRLRAIDAY